jgi:hypothetical protein
MLQKNIYPPSLKFFCDKQTGSKGIFLGLTVSDHVGMLPLAAAVIRNYFKLQAVGTCSTEFMHINEYIEKQMLIHVHSILK